MKPCRHDPPKAGCKVCHLYATDARYRRLWDGLPQAPSPASAAPCVHYGPRVDRTGQVREWHECLHPDKPLGELICRCRGCGPKCPGYSAGG